MSGAERSAQPTTPPTSGRIFRHRQELGRLILDADRLHQDGPVDVVGGQLRPQVVQGKGTAQRR